MSDQTHSKDCSTSHAGAVSWVHGSHRLRDSGRAAHATLVDCAHAEGIGTALHQASDGETGKLNRSVIALDPVGGSNLTSEHILQFKSYILMFLLKYRNIFSDKQCFGYCFLLFSHLTV